VAVVALAGLLVGCAGSAPPPSATALPWAPSLLTRDRTEVAADWRADVATREYIDELVRRLAERASCSPQQWGDVNKAWAEKQDKTWKALWTFQPIPNAPASTGSATDILSALAGLATKVLPLVLAAKAGASTPVAC
jgi:hypothetical protein